MRGLPGPAPGPEADHAAAPSDHEQNFAEPQNIPRERPVGRRYNRKTAAATLASPAVVLREKVTMSTPIYTRPDPSRKGDIEFVLDYAVNFDGYAYAHDHGIKTDDDYWKTPQMKAFEVGGKLLNELALGIYDLAIVNCRRWNGRVDVGVQGTHIHGHPFGDQSGQAAQQ